ncbi:YoaK family protein [Lactiplantibacillus plantarum]|uniref:YoaK family protein n=2 Tax=Lactiplantibacillus plantarum TaxID=1590 RepID=UPI002ACC262D|nr:YoaK family protein [Lactiplantibacillus plantarum]WQE71455.1 YoaK family protein [Lactiplantibacillus plantarum]
MQRFQSRHLFQLREIGLGLTCIGGFIDAYTFIQRGGVLAAGQTGNLIFLSVDVAQWNLPGVLTKLATVLFFTLGVIVVGILKQWLGARSHYWRLPVLVAELVVCLMVGMLPATVSNAMQTTAFSAIAGHGYNNVFSTGNLKKATIALTNYWLTGVRTELDTGLVYWELVLSFATGAIVSAILQRWWTLRTIWVAAGLLILVGGYYTWLLVHRTANDAE